MNKMQMIESKGGELVIIDYDNNIVTHPVFNVDAIGYPRYGFIQVKEDGSYGYLNYGGQLVIRKDFFEVYPFSENGLAFVKEENELDGYIDGSGVYVIKPAYKTGSTFRFDLAAVSREGVYYYINRNEQQTIAEEFQYASGFASCGLAHVQKMDGTHALINLLGEIVVAFAADYEIADFKEYAQVTTVHQNGKVALLDARGEMITPFYYEEIIISPNSGLHPFLRDGLWGYLDDYGNEVIPNIYFDAWEFTYNFPKELSAIVKTSDPSDENEVFSICITPKNEVFNGGYVITHLKSREREFVRVYDYEHALAIAELQYEEPEREREKDSWEWTPEKEAAFQKRIAEENKVKAEFMRKRNFDVSDEEVFNSYVLHEVIVQFKIMNKQEIMEFLG